MSSAAKKVPTIYSKIYYIKKMYIKLEFVLGRDSGAVKIPIYTKKTHIYIRILYKRVH